MQLAAPRKTQAWTRSYKERVARLTADGLMHAAGLASVEAGKRSGLWTFMDDVDALIVPDDLATAFTEVNAHDAWDALAPSYRCNVLRWIKIAKTRAHAGQACRQGGRGDGEGREDSADVATGGTPSRVRPPSSPTGATPI